MLLGNLDALRASLKEYGLVVCARAFDYKFNELRSRLGAEDEGYPLTEADVTEIQAATRSLRKTPRPRLPANSHSS